MHRHAASIGDRWQCSEDQRGIGFVSALVMRTTDWQSHCLVGTANRPIPAMEDGESETFKKRPTRCLGSSIARVNTAFGRNSMRLVPTHSYPIICRRRVSRSQSNRRLAAAHHSQAGNMSHSHQECHQFFPKGATESHSKSSSIFSHEDQLGAVLTDLLINCRHLPICPPSC